jgi:iron complex transport system substrate-binding protein
LPQEDRKMREHLVAASAKLALVTTTLVVLATAACQGASLGGPATSTGATTAHFPLTVKQSDGRTLTLAKAPVRIVSLSTAATEILCALGATAQLAAVEQNANCPSGSKAKPELNAYQPNSEAIVGYRPDLVYVFSDSSHIVATLRGLGVPVFYLELPVTLSGVLDQIDLLGRISGHDQAAQELLRTMRNRIAAVQKKLSSLSQGPRFFHELDPAYFTVSDHSFVGDLYTVLKAQNIAAGAAQDYPQLSVEVIIQRDPEVVVIADGPAGVTAASVKKRPGWQQVAAVRNDRICVVDPDLVSVPGPGIVAGLEALAKCLYPNRFP